MDYGLPFTRKQSKVLKNADSRWNILCGATRSGKTYISFFLILKRIYELPKGNCCMIGRTLSTLSYNVLNPMREIFGVKNVSSVRTSADGIKFVTIFGRDFRIIGANNKQSVTKLQGSDLIYAYGDEIATWHKDVFTMLKSRLNSDEARFDGTTNPDSPKHWLKEFIDSGKKKDLDIYDTTFTIDENDFLDKGFIENLKKEYKGTVYYDRFILGKWTSAEGSIYVPYNSNRESHIIDELPGNAQGFLSIGVDFGGTGSGQAFNCTLIDYSNTMIYTIKDEWDDTPMDTEYLTNLFLAFIEKVVKQYPQFSIVDVRADSAEQVLKNSLQSALIKKGYSILVNNSKKGVITERIRAYVSLFNAGRYKILRECKYTQDAFEGAVWADSFGKEIRLDDGTSNIDSLDAQEYSTEPYMSKMLDLIQIGG